jgi:hypothetical protein
MTQALKNIGPNQSPYEQHIEELEGLSHKKIWMKECPPCIVSIVSLELVALDVFSNSALSII